MRKLVLIAFLCFLVPLARADTYISDCSVLDVEGETYYLTADIIDSTASVCMDITANNIVLDCQGHTIDGVNATVTYGDGIRVYRESVESTNVTIKNCVVSDWWNGIWLYRADNNSIINSTANNNYDRGILLYESSNNTIINSSANGNFCGIRLMYSSYNTITNSTANYNLMDSIGIDNSFHSIITSNSIIMSGDYGYGIYTLQGAYNTIAYNVITTTGEAGEALVIYSSLNNTLIGNVITTSGSYGYGIHIERSSNYNTIMNNNVTTSGSYGYGVYIDRSSNNIITNNIVTVVHNDSYGIYITQSAENLIYNNIFNSTNLFFLEDVGTNFFNTTRQAGKRIYSPGTEIGGNYWTNADGTSYSDTCVDADKDGFCDEPYTLAEGNVDYLPLSDEYIPPTIEVPLISRVVVGLIVGIGAIVFMLRSFDIVEPKKFIYHWIALAIILLTVASLIVLFG